jgi:serine/threonine protein kinase
MGQVLLARDRVLEREVAIKLLRDDLAISEEVREALVTRMRHEARAAARVTHPNLVILHDMGEDEVLGLYLVFEYLDGPTLKQRVSEGRMPARQVARIARELGSALTFAHERGVLHRDVKPENVLITKTGAKLADFGIARVPDSTLTRQVGLLGTPAYSAPETFRETKFSPASDQFSLAATLYEALSGQRAFPGDDALTVANRIANEHPSPIGPVLGYSGSVDAVFARALSKSPAARYATCRDFGIALVEALDARMARRSGSTRGEDDDVDPSIVETSLRAPVLHELAPRERRAAHIAIGALVVLLAAGLASRACVAPTQAPSPAPSASSAPSSAQSSDSLRVLPSSRATPRRPAPRSTASAVVPELSAQPFTPSALPPTEASAAPASTSDAAAR